MKYCQCLKLTVQMIMLLFLRRIDIFNKNITGWENRIAVLDKTIRF